MATRAGNGASARGGLTSFVGRRHELARLRTFLSESRLVTITGPGGAGKTRLAEEFVASQARTLEGRVAVAYLASALSPEEVVDVVAAAVGRKGLRRQPEVLSDCLVSKGLD